MHDNQQDDSVNSQQTQPNKTKKNKKKWSAIPNAIIKDTEISANAFRVYCYLEMKPDNWTFWNKEIAESLGINERTVIKCTKELEARGWLSSEQTFVKGRRSNKVYTINEELKNTDVIKTDSSNTDSSNYDIISNTDLSNTDLSNIESEGGVSPSPSVLKSLEEKEPQADKNTASPCPLGGRQTQDTTTEELEDELIYDSGCNDVELSMPLMFNVIHTAMVRHDYILSRTVDTFCGFFSPQILRLPKQQCDDMLDQFAHSLHYSNYLITDVLRVVESRFKERAYNDFYVRDFLAALMSVLDEGKNYGLEKQA